MRLMGNTFSWAYDRTLRTSRCRRFRVPSTAGCRIDSRQTVGCLRSVGAASAQGYKKTFQGRRVALLQGRNDTTRRSSTASYLIHQFRDLNSVRLRNRFLRSRVSLAFLDVRRHLLYLLRFGVAEIPIG